jgi:hypothetical protein
MIKNVPLRKIKDPTRKGIFTPKKIYVHQMKVMEKKRKLRKFSL